MFEMFKKKEEKKKKNEQVEEYTCPMCGHHKSWKQRGKKNPSYKHKCTRCGNES